MDILTTDGRTAALTAKEWNKFKKTVEGAATKRAACKFFDVNPQTLDNILLRGTSKPDKIDSIRAKLSALSA